MLSNKDFNPKRSPIKRMQIGDDEHRTKFSEEIYVDMEQRDPYFEELLLDKKMQYRQASRVE